jgi:hypothetical protein
LIKTREHNDLFKTNFKGMLFGEAKIWNVRGNNVIALRYDNDEASETETEENMSIPCAWRQNMPWSHKTGAIFETVSEVCYSDCSRVLNGF